MDQTERMYELMRVESNRLKTFQMNPAWPKDYVDIKKLAKAGFFYAFNGDNVHCAFCRGQVCQWDRNDDPMSEHARHFTTCPFIMGGEVGNEPLGEDPFPGPKRPRPYDVCGSIQNFPPLDHRSQAPIEDDSGSDSHRRNQSNSDRLELYNHFFSSNYEQPNQVSNIIQPPLQFQPQVQSCISNHTPAYDDHSSESSAPTSLCSSGNDSLKSSSSLNGICKVCYTNPIELVFLPCGHSVSCLSCAQRLHSCPCCRAVITTRIRTYLV